MPSWSDLRYSVRSLTRTPGLTLTLLLTIALGIGSNASVAGFVRGLTTRNVPISGIQQVVSVFARDAQDAFGPVSYRDLPFPRSAARDVRLARCRARGPSRRQARRPLVGDDRRRLDPEAGGAPSVAADEWRRHQPSRVGERARLRPRGSQRKGPSRRARESRSRHRAGLARRDLSRERRRHLVFVRRRHASGGRSNPAGSSGRSASFAPAHRSVRRRPP